MTCQNFGLKSGALGTFVSVVISASLVLMSGHSTAQSTYHENSAAPEDLSACDLDAIARAGSELGYETLELASTKFQAKNPDGSQLFAVCFEGALGKIWVTNPNGSVVGLRTINSISEGKTLVSVEADLHGGAKLQRTYEFGGEGCTLSEASAVTASGKSATVKIGFLGYLEEIGDVELVNKELQRILVRDSAWNDFMMLSYVANDFPELLAKRIVAEIDLPEPEAQRAANEILQAVANDALPSKKKQDSDRTRTNTVCAGGAAACIAGLLGVVTAPVCAAGGVACLAAGACQLADCSGDG